MNFTIVPSVEEGHHLILDDGVVIAHSKSRRQCERIVAAFAVVEAAVALRFVHEGCVVDPACGNCSRCRFDVAVDDYQLQEKRR